MFNIIKYIFVRTDKKPFGNYIASYVKKIKPKHIDNVQCNTIIHYPLLFKFNLQITFCSVSLFPVCNLSLYLTSNYATKDCMQSDHAGKRLELN